MGISTPSSLVPLNAHPSSLKEWNFFDRIMPSFLSSQTPNPNHKRALLAWWWWPRFEGTETLVVELKNYKFAGIGPVVLVAIDHSHVIALSLKLVKQ